MYTYSDGNPGTEVSLKEVYLVSGRSKGLYPSNSGFRTNYHVIQVFKRKKNSRLVFPRSFCLKQVKCSNDFNKKKGICNLKKKRTKLKSVYLE